MKPLRVSSRHHSFETDKFTSFYSYMEKNNIVKRSDSVCGYPKLFPRVGNEYQAEIPPLIESSSLNQGIKVDSSDSSSLGLPIPVTRIHKKDDQVNSGESCDGFNLVPGLPDKDWEPIEKSSFLLGLFIFGKNLALIKRFVGGKEMGDILSYYYGKFYNSSDYQTWLATRKKSGRRCVSGNRIFTGWRQQELLSRLSPRVSEECRHMLVKDCKLFGQGKMRVEEYVFSIRDKVGIENLVEAIGIGKGKNDLTGTSIQSLPVRPRKRITKPCSSLTTTEILKFVTGKIRLSKDELKVIFWEGVWPRLLAQGWHSQKCSGVKKSSLVFLVPDVDKFSGSLAMGTQFFSSISDVLNKVASEPSLLELKVNSDNDKNMVNPEVSEKSDGKNQELMKFTVVDTSLGSGKVWEVRSLDLDNMNSGSSSEENHVDVDNDIISSIMNSKDEMANSPVSLVKQEKMNTQSEEQSSHKNSILDNSETEQDGEMEESINGEAIAEEPICQRRSSRNKPSFKALEAFAYGFLGGSKKRKSGNSS